MYNCSGFINEMSTISGLPTEMRCIADGMRIRLDLPMLRSRADPITEISEPLGAATGVLVVVTPLVTSTFFWAHAGAARPAIDASSTPVASKLVADNFLIVAC